jgi:hypothetical protein
MVCILRHSAARSAGLAARLLSLAVVAGVAFAQTPTPVQGRDAAGNKYRTVAVDPTGKLQVVVTSGGGSGCPGTAATPCVVGGKVAAGAAQTGNPLPGGGVDSGGVARALATDAVGQQAIANAVSAASVSGVSLSTRSLTDYLGFPIYNREIPYLFNGATLDLQYGCPNSVIVDDSTSGNVQIIAASGATQVHICKASFTTAAAVNIQFTQGTGANCVVGTANLSGLYQLPVASGVFEDFMSDRAPLVGAASQAVCLNLSTTTRTTGQVWYAQF